MGSPRRQFTRTEENHVIWVISQREKKKLCDGRPENKNKKKKMENCRCNYVKHICTMAVYNQSMMLFSL